MKLRIQVIDTDSGNRELIMIEGTSTLPKQANVQSGSINNKKDSGVNEKERMHKRAGNITESSINACSRENELAKSGAEVEQTCRKKRTIQDYVKNGMIAVSASNISSLLAEQPNEGENVFYDAVNEDQIRQDVYFHAEEEMVSCETGFIEIMKALNDDQLSAYCRFQTETERIGYLKDLVDGNGYLKEKLGQNDPLSFYCRKDYVEKCSVAELAAFFYRLRDGAKQAGYKSLMDWGKGHRVNQLLDQFRRFLWCDNNNDNNNKLECLDAYIQMDSALRLQMSFECCEKLRKLFAELSDRHVFEKLLSIDEISEEFSFFISCMPSGKKDLFVAGKKKYFDLNDKSPAEAIRCFCSAPCLWQEMILKKKPEQVQQWVKDAEGDDLLPFFAMQAKEDYQDIHSQLCECLNHGMKRKLRLQAMSLCLPFDKYTPPGKNQEWIQAFFTEWCKYKDPCEQRDLMKHLHQNRLMLVINELGYGKVFESYGKLDQGFLAFMEQVTLGNAIQYKQELQKVKDAKRTEVYAVIVRFSEILKGLKGLKGGEGDYSGVLSQQNLRDAYEKADQSTDPQINNWLSQLAAKIPHNPDVQLAALGAIEVAMALGFGYKKALTNRLPKALANPCLESASAEKKERYKTIFSKVTDALCQDYSVVDDMEPSEKIWLIDLLINRKFSLNEVDIKRLYEMTSLEQVKDVFKEAVDHYKAFFDVAPELKIRLGGERKMKLMLLSNRVAFAKDIYGAKSDEFNVGLKSFVSFIDESYGGFSKFLQSMRDLLSGIKINRGRNRNREIFEVAERDFMIFMRKLTASLSASISSGFSFTDQMKFCNNYLDYLFDCFEDEAGEESRLYFEVRLQTILKISIDLCRSYVFYHDMEKDIVTDIGELLEKTEKNINAGFAFAEAAFDNWCSSGNSYEKLKSKVVLYKRKIDFYISRYSLMRISNSELTSFNKRCQYEQFSKVVSDLLLVHDELINKNKLIYMVDNLGIEVDCDDFYFSSRELFVIEKAKWLLDMACLEEAEGVLCAQDFKKFERQEFKLSLIAYIYNKKFSEDSTAMLNAFDGLNQLVGDKDKKQICDFWLVQIEYSLLKKEKNSRAFVDDLFVERVCHLMMMVIDCSLTYENYKKGFLKHALILIENQKPPERCRQFVEKVKSIVLRYMSKEGRVLINKSWERLAQDVYSVTNNYQLPTHQSIVQYSNQFIRHLMLMGRVNKH